MEISVHLSFHFSQEQNNLKAWESLIISSEHDPGL